MGKKIRAILVGCGGMSGAWLKAASEIPDVEIVGLVDLNADLARKRADEFQLGKALIEADLTKALVTLKPDAVFDCTVPVAHTSVVLTAFEFGCHVLGEKPLADSMENARAMVNASRKAGRVYAVIQNYRYLPAIRRLKAFLDSGAIGKVTTVQANFFIGAHFGGFRDIMKNVLLLDMAIHTFDAARFLSGQDPEAVYCHEWNPPGSWYQHGASAAAIFEMSNGIVFNYHGSWCAEGMNTPWNSHWRIIGEKGSVMWDGAEGFEAEVVDMPEGFMFKMKKAEVPPGNFATKVNGHQGLMAEFVKAVQTGAVPETVADDNIKSLAMVFAAIESAAKKSRVAVIPE